MKSFETRLVVSCAGMLTRLPKMQKKPINIVNLTIYIDIIYLEMMDRGSDFQHFSRLIIKYGVIQPGIHYFEDIAHIYKIITQQSIEHHHDLILMQSGV